jgi:DNA polymerase I-like protein with 3'-5' exonuclease and polymerase domains
VRVYIHAGYTLDSMETRGPLLDWASWEKMGPLVDIQIASLDRELRQIANDPDFNPGASDQCVSLLYDYLKFPVTEFGRTSEKKALELLSVSTGNLTPMKIIQNRALRKIKTTYLANYANSARKHGGELRTIWWLTGAVTGRLRSGGGDSGSDDGVINMQNLHGSPILLNMLVSDLRWRRALET